jgi:hypothetical protein
LIVAARRGAVDAVDDGCGVAAVLDAVGGVNLVVDLVADLHEGDVLLDTASRDMALVGLLHSAEPGGRAPVHRAHIEIVAVADDPDDHWLAQGAIASH